MCFLEFIGYTCGHTSVPVKRPCPLTTQLHNLPCCANAAARPFLVGEMCPGCTRVVHGRFINIIEFEHRFMHERGTCHCEVKFPHLQQPRVVTHEVPGVASTNIGDLSLQGMAAGVKKEDDEKSVKVEEDTTDTSCSCSPAEHTPESTDTPAEKSNLSASAASFTPGHAQAEAQGYDQGQGSRLVRYDPVANADTTARGRNGEASAAGSSRPASVASWRHAGSTYDSSRRNSFSAEKGKDKDWKGKGKGKQRWTKGSGSRFAPSPSNRSMQHQGFQRQQQPGPSHASSSAAAEGRRNIPPLFVAGENGNIAVRMPSLYGAEWIQDHAERHRTGQCSCEIKFEKYPAVYMPMLEEAAEEEEASRYGDVNHSTIIIIANGSTSYGRRDAAHAPGVQAPRGDGMMHSSSSTAGPSYANSGYANSSYATPAVSGLLPTIGRPDQLQLQPQPQAQVPMPNYPGRFDHPSGQQGASSIPSSPNSRFPQPGRFARYIGAEPDPAADGSPSAAQPGRPFDVQTVWYNQADTPIAGLPIGAGPEGDSHMPPFEECELYHPAFGDRRPATR
ncbi:hypothetical protein F5Y05DRAFT_149376 [Hypoxylon sp. FL0543]|nr:hypothetical protein F5Y05DRAFT_149376 [Hypoxylon sp. FL0543]